MPALDPGTLRHASGRPDAAAAPWSALSFVVCVLVPLAFWFAPLGLEARTQHALAIIIFMVLAWMTQAMEFAIAGFVGRYRDQFKRIGEEYVDTRWGRSTAKEAPLQAAI